MALCICIKASYAIGVAKRFKRCSLLLYIKAGYGNFKSPYFRAHFTNTPSLLTSYAITAFHQSAQGNQNFQRFGQSGLMMQGFKKLPASPFILDGTIDVKRDAVFKYGVPAGIIIPSLDSLKMCLQEPVAG